MKKLLMVSLVHGLVSLKQITGKTVEVTYSYVQSVLSISFEVEAPTGKVGGSLLFERQRCELPRGVWGHAPPENFEI